MCKLLLMGQGVGRVGERQLHSGALIHLRAHNDFSLMQAYDVSRKRKPDAITFVTFGVAGAEEGVEDMFDFFFGYTDTNVFHDDDHVLIGRANGQCYGLVV